MKDVMFYKDFIGSVHYSTDDEIFYGKIEGINDAIGFEGSSVEELKLAFHEAVEDYVKLCEITEKSHRKHIREVSILDFTGTASQGCPGGGN